MITKYLEKYFQSSDDLSVFEAYLDKKFLVKELNQAKLYAGKEVAQITEYFNGA